MKAAFGIIMIFVAFTIFPMIMTASHDVLTDDHTVSANVSTGVGETTGSVTLTKGLYGDSTEYVDSITSDYASDSPTASSYASATKVLTVGGLVASYNRTLTVEYEYDQTTEYTGMASMAKIGPTILFICLLLGGAGMVYAEVRGKLG